MLRLVLPALLVSAVAVSARAQITVTYVANEGFLLEGGGHKVLVDALTGRGISPYPTVPEEMRAKLEEARAPFDGVDLVLATHSHADHFDAETVARHLRANAEALFVSTPQAADRLRSRLEAGSPLLDRVEAVMPGEGERETLRRRGLELHVLNLHHGRNRRPPVQNLGFLARMGGVTWLHVGDTEADEEDIRPYGLLEEGVDVAFLPTWFFGRDRWLRVVERQIRPVSVVVMHRVVDGAPVAYYEPDRDAEAQRRRIQDRFPMAVFFDEPGRTRAFPSSGSAP